MLIMKKVIAPALIALLCTIVIDTTAQVRVRVNIGAPVYYPPPPVVVVRPRPRVIAAPVVVVRRVPPPLVVVRPRPRRVIIY